MRNKFFKEKIKITISFFTVIIFLVTLWVFRPISDLRNDIIKQNDPYPMGLVEGNRNDLIYFSIAPGAGVTGKIFTEGSVKNSYFFEGNILINILDANKKVLKKSNFMAKTDWMTVGPVEFEGYIDFTGFSKGLAYIEIHNDNASGLPENDKSILIPIIIE